MAGVLSIKKPDWVTHPEQQMTVLPRSAFMPARTKTNNPVLEAFRREKAQSGRTPVPAVLNADEGVVPAQVMDHLGPQGVQQALNQHLPPQQKLQGQASTVGQSVQNQAGGTVGNYAAGTSGIRKKAGLAQQLQALSNTGVPSYAQGSVGNVSTAEATRAGGSLAQSAGTIEQTYPGNPKPQLMSAQKTVKGPSAPVLPKSTAPSPVQLAPQAAPVQAPVATVQPPVIPKQAATAIKLAPQPTAAQAKVAAPAAPVQTKKAEVPAMARGTMGLKKGAKVARAKKVHIDKVKPIHGVHGLKKKAGTIKMSKKQIQTPEDNWTPNFAEATVGTAKIIGSGGAAAGTDAANTAAVNASNNTAASTVASTVAQVPTAPVLPNQPTPTPIKLAPVVTTTPTPPVVTAAPVPATVTAAPQPTPGTPVQPNSGTAANSNTALNMTPSQLAAMQQTQQQLQLSQNAQTIQQNQSLAQEGQTGASAQAAQAGLAANQAGAMGQSMTQQAISNAQTNEANLQNNIQLAINADDFTGANNLLKTAGMSPINFSQIEGQIASGNSMTAASQIESLITSIGDSNPALTAALTSKVASLVGDSVNALTGTTFDPSVMTAAATSLSSKTPDYSNPAVEAVAGKVTPAILSWFDTAQGTSSMYSLQNSSTAKPILDAISKGTDTPAQDQQLGQVMAWMFDNANGAPLSTDATATLQNWGVYTDYSNLTNTSSSTGTSTTAGSSTAGSSTAGSSTAGSSTAGSSTAGSSTAGSSTEGNPNANYGPAAKNLVTAITNSTNGHGSQADVSSIQSNVATDSHGGYLWNDTQTQVLNSAKGSQVTMGNNSYTITGVMNGSGSQASSNNRPGFYAKDSQGNTYHIYMDGHMTPDQLDKGETNNWSWDNWTIAPDGGGQATKIPIYYTESNATADTTGDVIVTPTQGAPSNVPLQSGQKRVIA
jgi:hypothetical protein